MSDSIYHITLELLCNYLNLIFGVRILPYIHVTLFKVSFHTVTRKSVNHQSFIDVMHGVFHSQSRLSYDKKGY